MADPMMPKACSMPCIWRTFTNASSVVILMVVPPIIARLAARVRFPENRGAIAPVRR